MSLIDNKLSMKRLVLLFTLISSFSFSQGNIAVTSTSIFEGEPTLAVNPQNSQQLVAAWIGVDLILGGVIKTSTSIDGGLTWTTPISTPHVVSGNASADPSLQYDSNGDVFLCYIDYDNTNFTNGQIVVRKSSDNGLTWASEVEAINVNDCPGKLCVDRPWMEIDRSGGPNDGTIYVTSMNPDQPTLVTAPYNPYLAVSTDGGASFNTPRYLDTLGYLAGSTIQQPMPSPAIGADGTFYAAYPSYETSQSPFVHLYLAYSTTQGVDIDHSNLYTVVMTGVSNPYAKKASQLIADPTLPNHLVALNLSEANGDADIFFMETFDAVNWTTPTRLNQDPIGNGKMQDLVWGEFNENGDLAICWRDRRNASASGYQTETEIFGIIKYKDSTDFEQDFVVSSQQVAHDVILEGKGNDFMSVRYAGDTLYAIWGDVRTGTLNIYINRYNVALGTSSISEVVGDSPKVSIYPNPASEQITIKNFALTSDVKLVSINGEIVQTVEVEKVDISALSPGTYYLIGQIASGSFKIPFVKK